MKFTYLWGDVWKYEKYAKHRNSLTRACIYFIRSIQWFFLSPLYKFVLFCRPYEKKSFKWNVSVCAIFKNEAPFLKEWIEYHRLIGVEHFYLYNNFSTDNYMAILSPYIEKDVVTLIDWPISGNDNAQNKAYTDCLSKYRGETHWLAIIDLDEFINLKKNNSIGKWLQRYQKYPSVYLFWKHFGTTGIIKHLPGDLVLEKYTSCWCNLCNTGKAIVNNNFYFPVPKGHLIKAGVNFLGLNLSIPSVNDRKCFNLCSYPFGIKDVSAQLNHYYIRGFEDRYFKCFKRGFACPDSPEDYYEYDRITPYEQFCVSREYSIQRFLIPLKIRLDDKIYHGYND